jgi:hypothetical protein
MDTITLDPELQTRLNGLSKQITVVNEAGEAVGLFLPMQDYKALLRNLPIPFSEEEIQRRRKQTGGCSLEEIWQRLEKRQEQQ